MNFTLGQPVLIFERDTPPTPGYIVAISPVKGVITLTDGRRFDADGIAYRRRYERNPARIEADTPAVRQRLAAEEAAASEAAQRAELRARVVALVGELDAEGLRRVLDCIEAT